MFILGTSTVITYIPTEQIDLIAPLPQVLRAGYAPFGLAAKLVTLAIILTFAVRLGQASVNFTGITRLHATYRTPVNSILMVGVTAFIISTLGIIGVGQAEAFQLLFNAGGIFYAITYL